MTALATESAIPRPRLSFGLFAGAIAWLVHLVGAAVVAEWGCFAGLDRWRFGGVSAIAWTVIAITAATLLLAVAATWSAYRAERRYSGTATDSPDGDEKRGNDAFMAKVGFWADMVFALIILAQSVPILFFLTGC